jgi:hypothetical protein
MVCHPPGAGGDVKIASVRWQAIAWIAFGPPIAIFVAWFLLSDRTAAQILVWSNWLLPTQWTPYPLISGAALIILVAIWAYSWIAPLLLRGTYLRVIEGRLKVFFYTGTPISRIDFEKARVDGIGLSAKLILPTDNGKDRSVALWACREDGLTILERLKKAR